MGQKTKVYEIGVSMDTVLREENGGLAIAAARS